METEWLTDWLTLPFQLTANVHSIQVHFLSLSAMMIVCSLLLLANHRGRKLWCWWCHLHKWAKLASREVIILLIDYIIHWWWLPPSSTNCHCHWSVTASFSICSPLPVTLSVGDRSVRSSGGQLSFLLLGNKCCLFYCCAKVGWWKEWMKNEQGESEREDNR